MYPCMILQNMITIDCILKQSDLLIKANYL